MTKTRIAVLMILVGVTIIITFLFYSEHTTQQLNSTYPVKDTQGLHLEIPNAYWETFFFKDLEKHLKKVEMLSLRTVKFPEHSLEVRFWFNSLRGIQGLIMQCSNGKWSAIFLHEIHDHQPSSIKVENLEPPITGWETVWTELLREGILTLPDGYSKEGCKTHVLDGIGYVVETNVNQEYRTFSYMNPQFAECDEAKRISSMVEIILGEFKLDRFWEEPDIKAEERKYWSMLDKTKLDELKAYLAKYPNGDYLHLVKANIKNIEAAKLAKTTSNTNSSNLPNSSKEGTDPLIDRIIGEFEHIPSGKFTMGSSIGASDEQPEHEVIISRGFEMGKYEVTQEQWELVMGNNPSYFKGDKRLPVENICWNDVQQFINKLNGKSKKYTYRLPTEAEWEYACRANSIEEYSGNVNAMAWYANNSGDEQLNMRISDPDKIKSNICRTHPVGQKKPNAWGLYDMHGNVWEWCSDWYGNYSSEIVTDPSRASQKSHRVFRGGCWNSSVTLCRSAVRYSGLPFSRHDLVGFRLVRNFK